MFYRLSAFHLVLALCLPHARLAAQRPSESRWVAFPDLRLFPTAIADPTATDFGFTRLQVTDPAIPEAEAGRFELRMGAQFGVVRWQPRGDSGWAVQAGFEAGFNGQFDIGHTFDNIGWDGIFGLTVAAGRPGRLAFKLGSKHTSSHVGDEYAERTGRQRIDYTREELVLGVSWPVTRALRLYAEGAYAYHTGNDDLQEPGRAQAGAEWLKPASLGLGQLGWYAATDANAFQERDWEVDFSAALGLMYPSGGHRWRLGLGYHEGRVPIGEFYWYDEAYWSLGLAFDL